MPKSQQMNVFLKQDPGHVLAFKKPWSKPYGKYMGILVRAIYKNGRQFSSTAELEETIEKLGTLFG